MNGATSKNLPAVQAVAPMPEDTEESMRYNCPTVGNYKMFIIHKGKINFILILSLACFYFGFYFSLFFVHREDKSCSWNIFVIPRGTFGPILHVGFVHFFASFVWPWVSSSLALIVCGIISLAFPLSVEGFYIFLLSLLLISACYAQGIKILFCCHGSIYLHFFVSLKSVVILCHCIALKCLSYCLTLKDTEIVHFNLFETAHWTTKCR